MPIAQCFASAAAFNSAAHGSDPVQIWSQLANEPKDEMTITLIKREQQYGKSYPVMAHLYLPSICSEEKAERLKIALANALSTHFSMPIPNIFVLVRSVASGEAVEDGEILEW